MFNKSLLEIKFENVLVEVYGLMLNTLDHPSHSFPESVFTSIFLKNKYVIHSYFILLGRK